MEKHFFIHSIRHSYSENRLLISQFLFLVRLIHPVACLLPAEKHMTSFTVFDLQNAKLPFE